MSSDSNKSSPDLAAIVRSAASEVAPVDSDLFQQQQVNINVLLVNVTKGATTPDERITATRQAMQLADEFERQRLQRVKEWIDLGIETKTRDPDEMEKRRNNSVRRWLKISVGATTGIAGIGGLALAAIGATSPAIVLLGGFGLGVAVTAMLASGESVSSNDAVRIIQAIRGTVATQVPVDEPDETPPKSRRAASRRKK